MRLIINLYLVVMGAFLQTGTAFAVPVPTFEQFTAAMSKFITQRSKEEGAPRVAFNKLQTCFPAHHSQDTFLCLAEMELNGEGRLENFVQEVGIRKDGESWSVLDPSEITVHAACPALEIAQAEIRRIRSNPSIVITGEIDDLQGLFSEDRGMMRDKKGPNRLMCRYEGKVGTTQYLYISYAWYESGKYRIDEVEVWAD